MLARAYGLWPGTERTELRTRSGLRLGVLNCFEDTLTASGRDAARQGERDLANLLVNVTNDGWFAGSNNAQHVVAASSWRYRQHRREGS